MAANIGESFKEDRLKLFVLLTVIIGTFLGRLDQTVVSLALPKIMEDFSITVNMAGWIGTAYILANAVFVPIWGKLGDTIGRKKVYVIGFVVFIIGSVLAGLSWDFNSMIVFRVIQAIAGSADYPTAMAILAVTFRESKERAQALGLWSASFAAAAVAGPLIGGPLVDNFGWRSIFLVNLPVGILGLVMALAFVKESVSDRKTVKFDWWGAITLGVALSALVLVLDKGMDWGWFSLNSIISYLVTISFSVIFWLIERNHVEPLIDFKFFKIPVFTNALINNFVIFMGMMGSMFVIPVFVQSFLGLNATQTGYLFIPMAALMMISAPLGGSLTGKVKPRYVIAASTAVAALGLFLFSRLDPRSTVWDIILPLSVMAFGMGFGMAQRTGVVATAVPSEEIGVASSILALGRNIAGAFGIAVFATILNNATENNAMNIARESIINSYNVLDYQTALGLISLKAQIMAYNTVFVVAAAIVFAGAIAALWIRMPEGKQNERREGDFMDPDF